MSGEVLLGQEISLWLSEDGTPLDQITDIVSFSFSSMQKILQQGYLGEKTRRMMMVFEGVKGECDLHIHSAQWLQFMQDVKLKAQQVTNTIFSATGLFVFPDGSTANLTIPDLAFGELANNAKSNGDYYDAKVPFQASNWTQQLLVTVP